jgi:phosphoenolpyruvate carboxylase
MPPSNIIDPAPDPLQDVDAPLRDDVRLLGTLLGETLKSQVGEEFFDTVEEVRNFSKGARAGSTPDAEALVDKLAQLPADEMLPLARAFTQFLKLANIAEQHHQVRRNRDALRSGVSHPFGVSLDDVISNLTKKSITPEQIFDTACGLDIELVLTAHPTEVTRRTLLQKYNRWRRTCVGRSFPSGRLTRSGGSASRPRRKRVQDSWWSNRYSGMSCPSIYGYSTTPWSNWRVGRSPWTPRRYGSVHGWAVIVTATLMSQRR